MKTDSQLKQDIISELNWEPAIHASEIGVEVKDGIVTLAGHVASYGEKWDAERAAQRVSGVKALAIEIDVKLAGSASRTDGEIARTVENVLQWTTFLGKNEVKVMVEGGWVTLSGEVEWDYQRMTAASSVRYLMGVKGVSNSIGIRSKVYAGVIKSDIEAALKRRAHADAQKIAVDVDGADVTLSGTVHSWFERDQARNSAWGTPGVKKVVDNIVVAY
jgi:osmotically-inducible protein OsmY